MGSLSPFHLLSPGLPVGIAVKKPLWEGLPENTPVRRAGHG